MARPMLDRWEMPGVEALHVEEQRRLVDHAIPGRTGSLLQDMGSRPARLVITGSVYQDPDKAGFLQELRKRFASAEPVTFVADITNASTIGYVVVRDLQIKASAHDSQSYRYVVTLVESPPPQPPLDPLAAVDAQIGAEAGAAMDGLSGLSDMAAQAGLPSLEDLASEVGFPPDLGALEKYDLGMDWDRLLHPLEQPMEDAEALAGGKEKEGELARQLDPVVQQMRLEVPPVDAVQTAAAQVTGSLQQALTAVRSVPAGDAAAAAVGLEQVALPDLTQPAGHVNQALSQVSNDLTAAEPDQALRPLTQAGQEVGQAIDQRVLAPLRTAGEQLSDVANRLQAEPARLVADAAAEVKAWVAPVLAHDAPAQVRSAAAAARHLLDALQQGTAAEDVLGASLAGTLESLLTDVRSTVQTTVTTVQQVVPKEAVQAFAAQQKGVLKDLCEQLRQTDWNSAESVRALVKNLEKAQAQMVALRTKLSDASAGAEQRLKQLRPGDLFDPITGSLRRLGDIRVVNVDPTEGRLLELTRDLANGVSKIDLSGTAGRLVGLVREARQQLQALDLSRQLQAAIDGLHKVEELCARVEQARMHVLLALQQVLGQAEQALGSARQTISSLRTALQEQAGHAQQGLAAARQQVELLQENLQQAFTATADALEEARTTVAGATNQLHESLRQVRQSVADLRPEELEKQMEVQLEPILAQLEQVHFTGPVDLALGVVDELHKKIAAIRFDDLNPLARGAIAAAKVLLAREADTRLPPVKADLINRFNELRTSGPERALAEADARWQAALAELDPLDPANWLDQVEQPFQELLAEAGRLDPGALLTPLDQAHARLAAWVDALDPGAVLAPLQNAFQQLQAQVERLDPTVLVKEVRKLQQRLEEALDDLGEERLIARLTNLLAQLHQALASLKPDQLMRELRKAAAEANAVIDGLDPERLYEAIGSLFGALDKAVANLADEAVERLDKWLQRVVGPIGQLAELVIAPVDAALAELEKAVADFSPGALVQWLRKEAYLELKQAAEQLPPGEDRDAVKKLVKDLDPLKSLSQVATVHDRVQKLVTEVRATWQAAVADLKRLAAEGKGALLRILPEWAAERPLLKERVLKQLCNNGFRQLVDELKRAYEPLKRFRQQIGQQLNDLEAELNLIVAEFQLPEFDAEELSQALQTAATAVKAQLVAALSIDELEDEFADIGQAVKELVGSLDPAFLTKLAEQLLGEVEEAVQALDPSPIAEALTELYATRVLVLLKALTPRALVEPELTDLFRTVRQKLHDLGLRHLAAPVLRELDRLGDELEEELNKLFDRVQALPAAIPI